MERASLRIGQRVRVVPKHTYNEDGSIKHHPEIKMYVRELYNPLVAGLSRKKTGKRNIYGILYEIIQPINKKQLCSE